MKITLIAVGRKMPGWVEEGFSEYARRMPRECSLNLVEVEADKRGRSGSPSRWMESEGRRIIAAIPKGDMVVALDVEGVSWSTEKLSSSLGRWMQDGVGVSLLVGGPDGLSRDCLQHAQQQWSLSKLTLPHPLVRVVVAEQLYRAWTILGNHPYHRS